jgi:hypothetical protein
MICENIHDIANKFLDKTITQPELAELEAHLEYCRNCKRTFGAYKKLSFEINNIDSTTSPPAAIFEQLVINLQSTKESGTGVPVEKSNESGKRITNQDVEKGKKKDKIKSDEFLFTSKPEIFWKRHKMAIWLALIILLICAAGILYFTYFYNKSTSPWQIIGYSGTYQLSDQKNPLNNFYLNQKITTSENGSVVIAIPKLGKLSLEPRTEIQLLNDKENSSRVYLYKGKVTVTTFVQNRQFSVETLNAAFTENLTDFSVEQLSSGITHVKINSGLLTINLANEVFKLPGKYRCDILTKNSYNIPVHLDASIGFINGIKDFEIGNISIEIISRILDAASDKDIFSLWHLIKKANRIYRPLIFDRLNSLSPAPEKVKKDGVIQLDDEMMNTWLEKMLSQI